MTHSTLRFVAVAFAIAANMVVSASAAIVPATDARITEVTVFRDRAEITREAQVQLPAGASTVRFEAIPIGVEADSLRVRAEGIATTLGAVEVVEFAGEPEESEEFVAVRDEIERLEASLTAAGEESRVDGRLEGFLAALQAATAERVSHELGDGRADPASLGAVYELLATRYAEISSRRLDRNSRMAELNDKLTIARAKLATLRPATSIRSRQVAVEVETREAGPLAVRLSYVVPGASWRPSYRTTLDAKTGDTHLVAEGVVRQGTGEDWSSVRLNLSSASPAQGVEPPMLTPWFLRPVDSEVMYESVAVSSEEDSERFYQNVSKMAPGVADPGSQPAASAETVLVRSAYNVAFEVPGSSDVPADGRDHRVTLRTEDLAGNLVYRIVPDLDPRAYLTSVATSPAGYPLLAGPVRAFAGGAYLGTYPLEEKGPGVELTLPFGVDNRIEVVRVREPQSAGKAGFRGSRREVSRAFRTQISNLRDVDVTVVLEERVPVSEDEDIVVEVDERRTSDGYEDSPRRAGVKIWTFDLTPGEKREITLAYTVKLPKDLIVPGL